VISLTGKVAIVTGASKGIGAGVAKSLGEAGAAVAVNYDSDRAGAERTVAEIVQGGGRAFSIQGRIGNETDTRRIFEDTTRTLGGFDIVVNNAGVYGFTPIAEITEQEIRRQFETNVFGLFYATREAVKTLGSTGGSIIKIGSFGTELNIAGSSIYTATKGAAKSITLVLANELGPRGIRVNSVDPGLVLTEGVLSDGLTPDSPFVKEMIARTPLGRVGTAKDVGDVVVFLASERARWVTGQIVRVSGGAQ
jgi:3-oxoacyl-[acyl-carrier protein] reductase